MKKSILISAIISLLSVQLFAKTQIGGYVILGSDSSKGDILSTSSVAQENLKDGSKANITGGFEKFIGTDSTIGLMKSNGISVNASYEPSTHTAATFARIEVNTNNANTGNDNHSGINIFSNTVRITSSSPGTNTIPGDNSLGNSIGVDNIVLAYTSVSAMRAAGANTNGAKATTSGYYAANDGGGGTFIYNNSSTASVDSGSVIKPTGVTKGRWLLVHNGTINPKQFGLKADGATDNTADFQSLVNTANVKFTTGTYKISGTVYLPSNRTIDAENGTTLLGNMTAQGSGGYPNTMFMNADTVSGNANIVFNNIKFDFNKRSVSYATGAGLTSVNSLWFVRITNLQFNNCEFFDFVTNYNSSLTKKKLLKFAMGLVDKCNNVSFSNTKSSNIREEGFQFYECNSVSFDNWIADGSAVTTSSHAGFWYCKGVSVKNSSFTHTGGSVLNICSSNVVIDNVRVNKGHTQAGRGFDFGNEIDAKVFNANNISVTNCYLNVKQYGIQNPSDTATKMSVKTFVIKNNTFEVGENSRLCSGIFLRGATSSEIVGNTFNISAVTTSGIGRCIVLVPYNNQTISSSITDNTMSGNTGVELYYATGATVNNIHISENTFTSNTGITINTASSLTGNSGFFYFRTTSGNTEPYFINNIDISNNTLSNMAGSFIVMNLDVSTSVNLKAFSVTNNIFNGVSALSSRGIQIGGTGLPKGAVVRIADNEFKSINSIVLIGLSGLKLSDNRLNYASFLSDDKVKIYGHKGTLEANNNIFESTSTSGKYSDIKQITSGTYKSVNMSGNTSISSDKTMAITTNIPINTAGIVGKLKIQATDTAASTGTATLVAGKVKVRSTAVTANSKIVVIRNTKGGTVGVAYDVPKASKRAGTSFVIRAIDDSGNLVTTETSTVDWWIID